MTYEPIEKSWWAENKPDFVDDFMSLPRNSRILVILMSVVLIGGGTAGCIIAAKGGVYIPSSGATAALHAKGKTTITRIRAATAMLCSILRNQGKTTVLLVLPPVESLPSIIALMYDRNYLTVLGTETKVQFQY